MRIKSILGFCSCKGCKNRYDYEVEVKNKRGKKLRSRLCMKCAAELIVQSKIKSATLQQTVNFDREEEV